MKDAGADGSLAAPLSNTTLTGLRTCLKVDADEDGVGGDDAADCLRHLVATKARTAVQRKLMGL